MAEGLLSIVATPIGNLDDITRRAVSCLGQADRILAEDTRHTRKLLNHLGVDAKELVSVHEHNERGRVSQVLAWLEQGERLVLVSDAGTPLISDPGYPLVNAARQAGYRVEPIPGPCALIAALSASGLPTDRFRFEGFLPARSGARVKRLEALAGESATLVFYESTHRIRPMIEDLGQVLGPDRYGVIARELTKTFETFLSGTLLELADILAADTNQCRGEFVVMVKGAPTSTSGTLLEENKLLAVLAEYLPPKTAAVAAVKLLGGRKRDWYDRLLAGRQADGG